MEVTVRPVCGQGEDEAAGERDRKEKAGPREPSRRQEETGGEDDDENVCGPVGRHSPELLHRPPPDPAGVEPAEDPRGVEPVDALQV